MRIKAKKIYKRELVYKDMNNKEKLPPLAAFLRLLKEDLDFDFNRNSLDDRIKLQKYVFIAKSFGLNLGYYYSLYIHGPYSPNLARDYYNLNLKSYDYNTLDLKRTFNFGEFKLAVQGKSTKWLEIASTALSLKEMNHNLSKDELFDTLVKIKGSVYKEQDIQEILDEAIKYLPL